jgi:hypothetical protein
MFTAHERRIITMNAPHIDTPGFLPRDRFALPRYRVCLHSVGSDQTRRVAHTNSAEQAVHEFLSHRQLTDGSDLYIWDREKKEIVAQIAWIDEPTTFGTTIRVRTNQFHDHSLAEIARRLCERVEIRQAVVQSVAL